MEHRVRSVLIHGVVDEGWGAVADQFAANFEARGDVGAACSVYHDGQAVVDIWGGIADPASGRRWERDTLQQMFSTSKGLVTVCTLGLAQRGDLDLDAPIAQVWPEFAVEGKETITLRSVLSHRSGLPTLDPNLSRDDLVAWEPTVQAIARQRPEWAPGTKQGYHSHSLGYIVGEVVRRVSGRSVGELVADEIAGPLGLELWIGLPPELEYRVAPILALSPEAGAERRAAMEDQHGSLRARALGGPVPPPWALEEWNSPALRESEHPAANAIGTARSVARMYAATVGAVDGVRLLTVDSVEDAIRVQSDNEPDLITGTLRRYGTGFELTPSLRANTGPRAFGHDGGGGSAGLADPDASLGFGYLMNAMDLGPHSYDRASALINAAYECV